MPPARTHGSGQQAHHAVERAPHRLSQQTHRASGSGSSARDPDGAWPRCSARRRPGAPGPNPDAGRGARRSARDAALQRTCYDRFPPSPMGCSSTDPARPRTLQRGSFRARQADSPQRFPTNEVPIRADGSHGPGVFGPHPSAQHLGRRTTFLVRSGVKPGWAWLPPNGASPRLEAMPTWVRLWYWAPFIDRWAYVWMWNRGGWWVEPPGSAPPPEDASVREPIRPTPPEPNASVAKHLLGTS
jgi:hypothetical protein